MSVGERRAAQLTWSKLDASSCSNGVGIGKWYKVESASFRLIAFFQYLCELQFRYIMPDLPNKVTLLVTLVQCSVSCIYTIDTHKVPWYRWDGSHVRYTTIAMLYNWSKSRVGMSTKNANPCVLLISSFHTLLYKQCDPNHFYQHIYEQLTKRISCMDLNGFVGRSCTSEFSKDRVNARTKNPCLCILHSYWVEILAQVIWYDHVVDAVSSGFAQFIRKA